MGTLAVGTAVRMFAKAAALVLEIGAASVTSAVTTAVVPMTEVTVAASMTVTQEASMISAMVSAVRITLGDIGRQYHNKRERRNGSMSDSKSGDG